MRPVCKILTFLIAMTLVLGSAALATQAPTPVPDYPPEGHAHSSEEYILRLYHEDEERKNDLVTCREILRDYGYYDTDIDNNYIYSNNTLIDNDMVALEMFCRTNGMEYDQYGLLLQTWYDMLDRKGKNTVVNLVAQQAQPAAQYAFIPYGTTGSETISSIQGALSNWGFLQDAYTPGNYEESTYNALSACFAFNNIVDTQRELQGLSAELQRYILENGNAIATPSPSPVPVEATPEPTAAVGAVQKVRNYFLAHTKIGGIGIPNLALWLIGIVLIVLIIFAVAHFFGPGVKTGSSVTPGKGNVLSFDIMYNGQQKHFDCIVTKVLNIGRGVGVFPLFLDDTSVSRKHCEIFYQSGQLMLKDYSTLGTLVNDRMVNNTECRLNPGDRIRIGDHYIVLNFTPKGR
ncbi:MAG: FHA domain-containing protein [Clostridia bacterium]|nr:FHA domain-containing protein [Clostridia bacterium]